MGALQDRPHIDTQGDVVVFDALLERRGIDDILVIVVRGDVVAGGLAEVFQDAFATQNLSHGEGREPIEVDDALMAFGRSAVALRPFANVAVETHGRDVAAWRERHLVAIGDEVGEGQRLGVGMVHQFAEADRERSDRGRHEQVGAAGCLGASLEHAPVHGPHLVGMVGEVGGRSRVVEREHRSNQQAALVVGGREWAAEGRAGLAIAHVAIGEEDTLGGRETVGQLAGFAHEAVLDLHAIDDGAAVGDDTVLGNDARADIDRGVGRGEDRAVAQS